jgi:small nuclear ribonucleoprotein (snRNP)-like protein
VYFHITTILFFILILKHLAVKLNGGRTVIGISRGFDPFVNMAIDDESIEERKDGTGNNIGTVVSFVATLLIFMKVDYANKIKILA